MKVLIVGSLSLLLVALVGIPAANAQKIGLNVTLNNPKGFNLTPFNLIFLARQGYFRHQGIPSSNTLKVGYQNGRISAEDLVKSAVVSNRLAPQVLHDRQYLNEVNALLIFLP